MDPTVTLLTLDDKKLVISKKAACTSLTLSELMEDLGEVAEIPVKIKYDILKIVAEWAEHHKFDSPEEIYNKETGLVATTEWDLDLIKKLSDDQIGELILACNMLNMKPFLDIVGTYVAKLIKGKTPEELRQILDRTQKPKPDDLSSTLPGVFNQKPAEVHTSKRVREE